jgi:N-acetyltransferase
MHLQPTLQDDYLYLRPLAVSDKAALYQAASDPLIWEQHPSQRHLEAVFDPFFQDSLNSGGALVVIDRATDRIIGTSRYQLLPDAPAAVEIGWTFLARQFWGGTTNGRMKKLMIDHAHAEGMEQIVFKIAIKNLRSQKAVEKIGGVRLTTPYKGIWDERADYYSYILERVGTTPAGKEAV